MKRSPASALSAISVSRAARVGVVADAAARRPLEERPAGCARRARDQRSRSPRRPSGRCTIAPCPRSTALPAIQLWVTVLPDPVAPTTSVCLPSSPPSGTVTRRPRRPVRARAQRSPARGPAGHASDRARPPRELLEQVERRSPARRRSRRARVRPPGPRAATAVPPRQRRGGRQDDRAGAAQAPAGEQCEHDAASAQLQWTCLRRISAHRDRAGGHAQGHMRGRGHEPAAGLRQLRARAGLPSEYMLPSCVTPSIIEFALARCTSLSGPPHGQAEYRTGGAGPSDRSRGDRCPPRSTGDGRGRAPARPVLRAGSAIGPNGRCSGGAVSSPRGCRSAGPSAPPQPLLRAEPGGPESGEHASRPRSSSAVGRSGPRGHRQRIRRAGSRPRGRRSPTAPRASRAGAGAGSRGCRASAWSRGER